MNISKVELDRVFLCSIDSAKSFVEYNEYTLDPDGEICQYIMQLFARNFDNTTSKKSYYHNDSYIAQIVPESMDGFDAFVDVVADEIHTLVQEAVDLPSGSGLFIWATVEEQPIIAFFKLNYQKRFSCKVEDGTVNWFQQGYILPNHTQKEYDYFYINVADRKAWMSDTKCHVGDTSINYMSDRILKLTMQKSEKQAVTELENAVIETIKECYTNDAPQKVFEYRQTVLDNVEDFGSISPKKMEEAVFADNEAAKEVYKEKLETMKIPEKPVEVSNKTKRQLKKKQKIVTENGIEIWIPIEYLEDKSVFDYRQDATGNVSIVIKDVGGNLK